MHPISDTSILSSSPLFRGLSPEELPAALELLCPRVIRCAKGGFLLRQNDPVPGIGLLTAGRAHILREDFWGNRDLISPLGPGQLFGEVFACTGRFSAVSVQAESDCAALLLDASRLLSGNRSLHPHHTRLLRNLLAVTAEKNLLLNDKLTHVTRRTTRQKLLSYLSREAQQQGSAVFDLPYNRQQLADYLAVDRSAMSAALSALQREGLIRYRKQHFTLLRDPER